MPGVRTSNVTASGAIVVSEQRNIWWEEESKRRIAFAGTRRIQVGGPTYRRTVVVNRTGWSASGGGTAYRIRLRGDGGDWQYAHRSSPARADPTVAGRNVTIDPLRDRPDDPNAFAVNVTRAGEALGRGPVPANGSRVTVGGLRRTGTVRRAQRHPRTGGTEGELQLSRVAASRHQSARQRIRNTSASMTLASVEWWSNWRGSSSSARNAWVTSPPLSAANDSTNDSLPALWTE